MAEEAEAAAEAPPEGCKPMMIGMKNMKKYELKNGEGLRDVVPYKTFDKEWVQDEVNKLGFYSDFHEFRKDIEKVHTLLAALYML